MSRSPRHFSIFVLLSLFLHAGVVLYFSVQPEEQQSPPPPPFFVDLRDQPKQPRPRLREIDLPERPPAPLRPTPARRLGPSDQVVPKEQAPQGDDTRDTATAPQPPPSLPAAAPREAATPQRPLTTGKPGTLPAPDPSAPPQLSREELLKSTSTAAQSIAELDPEVNRRMRREVEEGRAVMLDTEKDILGSFYKRFRNSIEDVWVYPREAITLGESGVCLYRIVVNRAGVIIAEPELLRSSGSARLDAEAARAVREASPRFGFLPDAFPYETLTIFAYFDYRIGTRPSLYGERYYYR